MGCETTTHTPKECSPPLPCHLPALTPAGRQSPPPPSALLTASKHRPPSTSSSDTKVLTLSTSQLFLWVPATLQSGKQTLSPGNKARYKPKLRWVVTSSLEEIQPGWRWVSGQLNRVARGRLQQPSSLPPQRLHRCCFHRPKALFPQIFPIVPFSKGSS